MKQAIEVQNLAHSYGKQTIYENLNFSVPRGRIFGLLGKNGVGKTTLIKILMGFLHPTFGRCLVLGEESHNLSPKVRAKIGLLFEGHLAYEFMTIAQIEKFYSAHYPDWNRELYYGLVDKLALPYNHLISNMSCGQRSQVVLGLIFAQNPELMILDDYSMGLDAGYRRLFLDYLREYVKDGTKTVLVTSHIVQDLEQLVDDVIFLDRGGKVLRTRLNEFMSTFKQYCFKRNGSMGKLQKDDVIHNIDITGDTVAVYSFKSREEVLDSLRSKGIEAPYMEQSPMTLEDAFIGLTGKY
jgi:ABC-2 type transport system ATP-binding protein